jgi:hypothetical protein
MKLASHFLCFALLIAVAQTVTAKTPEFNQFCALVDGALLPFLQCNTNEAATNKSSGFVVVIVDNADLREKLSEKYLAFSKCFKFEPEKAVLWRSGSNGHAEGYIHKATGRLVCVDRFEVVSTKENKCSVKWSDVYASLGGFTKIVTLVLVDNKWTVGGIKLETVS